MSSPAVRKKWKEEQAMAEILKDPVVAQLIDVGQTGAEVTDPLAVLRKCAASIQRLVEYYSQQPGEDPNDERLDKALVLLDRLERACTTLVKLGQTDRALDAAELRQMPVWIELEDKIVGALAAHPEARAAVFAALTAATPAFVAGEVL